MTVMKKCIVMLIVLIACISFLDITASAAQSTAGISVSTGNDASGENWTWDADTLTLILNGVDINTSAGYAVSVPSGATIKLIGQNRVVTSGSQAIRGNGTVTIEGTGILYAEAPYAGICSTLVIIKSGIITAKGATNGIYAGTLHILGGTIKSICTAEADTDYSSAIKGGNITISGGTVEAIAEKTRGIYFYGNHGTSNGTTLSVTGGTLHVKAATAGIVRIASSTHFFSMEGGAVTVETDAGCGLDLSVGVVSSGTLTVKSGGSALSAEKYTQYNTMPKAEMCRYAQTSGKWSAVSAFTGSEKAIILAQGTPATNGDLDAALGHSYTTKASSVRASAATCTTAAKYYIQCDYCSAYTTGKTIAVGNKLGHSFGDWETVTAADYVTDGLEKRTCSRTDCGEEETRAIPAIGPAVLEGIVVDCDLAAGTVDLAGVPEDMVVWLAVYENNQMRQVQFAAKGTISFAPPAAGSKVRVFFLSPSWQPIGAYKEFTV